MLAAGLGLGLVVGLGLAGLTSTLAAALHVGSERLLAGFDALSGSHTLELLRSRRLHGLKSSGGCCEAICTLSDEILMVLESAGGCCEAVCIVLQCILMMFL